LKSTETSSANSNSAAGCNFSNFGSLKSTETDYYDPVLAARWAYFSNFGSLKSTETQFLDASERRIALFQQFRLVEEH